MRRPALTAGIAVVVCAVAVAPLLIGHPFVLHLATQSLIWGLLAASWDILGGYSGQVSFGHAGFFAVGAYAGALLPLQLGLPLWAGMAGAVVSCSALGLCAGFPALRLRGHYLALVTLGLGETVQLVARNWESVTGGTFGLHDFGGFGGTDAGAKQALAYGVVAGVSVLALAAMLALTRWSDVGNAFRAIREDETLAQSLGINTTFFKLLAFVVSAGFCGLAGALYAYHVQLVSPSLSTVGASAVIIGMAIFGGIGTIWGAFLGGVLLFLITEGLRFVGVVYNLVAVGLVMMTFVIFLPRGLAGLRWGRRGRIQRGDASAGDAGSVPEAEKSGAL